jgi:hypothetical protein
LSLNVNKQIDYFSPGLFGCMNQLRITIMS